MAGLNQATICGRLGKDPESKSFQNGGGIVSFSIATSETWNDKATGERKEKTEWHNVVIQNEGAGKVAMQYLRKGSEALIVGKLQTRKWQDQSGSDKYTTEIVVGSFHGSLTLIGGKSADTGERSAPATRRAAPAAAPAYNDLDDDVPF
jgi:single-strand DNA-binding protein